MSSRLSRMALMSLLAAVVLAACGMGSSLPPRSPSGSDGPSGSPNELTVYGAASLTEVLAAAQAAYEASTPGVSIMISTGSSAALATQIELGAPADIFLSADSVNAARLVDGGFAAGNPVVFAANGLTVIVPPGNPGGIASPADLARDGLQVVAAGDEVPITRYANQLVANLASRPDYPADFAAAYARNIASREDNVKAVVGKIELGEGDAGIVYVTDAAATSAVETVAVPEGANVVAEYEGVVIRASRSPAAAAAFLEWFAGPDGRAILADHGFLPPAS